MNDDSVPKYATLSVCAGIVNRSVPTVSRLCARDKIKKRKDGTYDVARVIQAVEDAAKRDLRNPNRDGGNPATLKDAKLMEEIGILRVKRLEAEKMSVPLDDHIAELQQMASWLSDAMTMWAAGVRVLTGDPKLVSESERLRDNVLMRVKEMVEKDGGLIE